jgi:DNA-binding CsgD family transcriptional regulator
VGIHGELSDRRHEDTLDLCGHPFACVCVSTDNRRLRIEGDPERELSGREVQVLERVALGHANREIGDGLSISEGTVKNHLKNIARKLDARDRTHAVVLAMASGLIDQPASIIENGLRYLKGKV